MSLRERVKLEVEVTVDVAYLAEQFAALTDDAQAQFLCIAAERLEAVKPGVADIQAWRIGRHLRECECSTEQGRAFVRSVVTAMEDRP